MFIEDNAQLESFIEKILHDCKGTHVAIDTEFIREKTYWPDLCLVQVAVANQAVTIDALKTDIHLLKPLLLAPDILKVFHAAHQDVEIFWHRLKVMPTPFFDSQIGAMFAGMGEGISYESLVQKLLTIKLDKSSQYTNWAQRPLSEQQISYALADVQYLYLVYPVLSMLLKDLGRQEWLIEELAQVIDPKTYDLDPQDAWRRIHMPAGRGQNLAVLQDLAAWREREAMQANVNRARIIRDEYFIKIALRLPKTLDSVKQCLSGGQGCRVDQLTEPLFEIVTKSLARSPNTWPHTQGRKPEPVKDILLLDLLRIAQRTIAQQLGIPARLLIKKGDLEKLVNDGINDSVVCLSGWRYEAFGRALKKILSGKIGITQGQKGVAIKELITP